MAFNFNGNAPKKILYNGLNVAKLIYNGVVVWMSKVLATIEGILPLNLTNCTGDDLVDYKVYGNTDVSKKSVGDLVTDTSDINYGKYKIPVLTNSHTTNIYLNKPLRRVSKLPYGYTELEHIRGTGTQYIDTNFIPNQDTRIKVKIMTKDISGMTNKTVFGSRESTTSKHYSVTMGNGSQNSWWTGYGTSNIGTNSYALRDTLYEIEKNKNVTILNGSVLATSPSQTFTCPGNLYLFCMNQNGTKFYSNIELYSCKIWDNDVLIRNFIPCKNPSNEIGMYDLVNDVFYTNAGSGSFVAGAEVETVYYTDYLDYENQKVVRNVDDNDKGIDTSIEESVVLPAVPTDDGAVTVDVDTVIAPSYAEVVYYKNDV